MGDPSLSIQITQDLPSFGLPVRAEAVLDARNLLDAQTTTENTEILTQLLSGRRSVRGGISVRFVDREVDFEAALSAPVVGPNSPFDLTHLTAFFQNHGKLRNNELSRVASKNWHFARLDVGATDRRYIQCN